ncbi:flagellar biosynthetic protein FliO [Eubacteriaceae bacterium ES3]|nr:flagellar biosynthetic protein FliO [Eubacteriaceae bacterium ES3]
MNDVFSVVLALLGTIGVLILTYYGSHWYAKRVARASGNITGGNHIKVVERIVVSKSSSLVIVDIEGQQLLLGISEQNISLIKELDTPLEIPVKKELSKDSFASILKSMKNKEQ